MTLPKYHAMPPLSKKHTPTIPQMEDKHELESLEYETMQALQRACSYIVVVLGCVFVWSLVIKFAWDAFS